MIEVASSSGFGIKRKEFKTPVVTERAIHYFFNTVSA
jgi:hypothetical protein